MSKTINTEPCPVCHERFCPGCPTIEARQESEWVQKNHELARESTDKIRKALITIIDELNHMGNEEVVANAVARQLNITHRTLQQQFMDVVIKSSINYFAWNHDQHFFDARNEATCALAKNLKEVFDESYLPFI